MALFKKIDLIAYRNLIKLQLAILPLSPVLTEVQRKNIANIYVELIAILGEAIAELTEVTEPEIL